MPLTAAIIALRPICEEDDEFLRRLYASTRETELALTGWTQTQMDVFLNMQFDAQQRHYFDKFCGADFDIIEQGGERAGHMYVERGEETIRLIDLALLPQYRNRCIGTRLIGDLLAEAVVAGKPVCLTVEQSNPAGRLYERLGFTQTGDDGVYRTMQWLPMALRLPGHDKSAGSNASRAEENSGVQSVDRAVPRGFL